MREGRDWELHLYEGLKGGRAAVILKLHHAISDGIGLVGMISGFVEFSREGDAKQAADLARPPRRAVPGALLLTRRALADRARKNLARGRGLVSFAARKLPSLARHPIETTRSAANGVRSLARLLVPSSGPMSGVMTERSMSCRFDVVFVPLADLKSAAKAAGGTVNDAFVAAVTSGLRRYHERFGAPVHELRMNMAINVRDSAADSLAGNQFLPVRFLVRVAILDPRERIREIRRRTAAQRSEPALSAVDEIASFLSALPGDSVARIAGGLMKTVTFPPATFRVHPCLST